LTDDPLAILHGYSQNKELDEDDLGHYDKKFKIFGLCVVDISENPNKDLIAIFKKITKLG